MSAQDAEGIRKHVSKLRFSRHATTMYEESVRTRASLDRLTAAIVAATSQAENRAEDASNERHEHAVTVKGLLEKVISDLLAVRSLPPAVIGGNSGTPVASSSDTLGGVGSSSGSSSSSSSRGAAPVPSAGTVARHKRQTKKWAGSSRRAHWLLAGAPPINLQKSNIQSVLGDTTKVTGKVVGMLCTLQNFRVRLFYRPGLDYLPLETHTAIMCQAIVSLAAESIPPSGGALENTERQLCQARVQELEKALGIGSTLLKAARMRHRMATESGRKAVSTVINADMATWTLALHTQAALLKDTLPGCPKSEVSLGSLCLPTWPKLKALVSSLEKPKKGSATPKASRKHKSSTSKLETPGAKTATPGPKKKKTKTTVKRESQDTSTG